MKQFSIIIPIYEPSEQDIKRCLDSIYTQKLNFNDFEVICVDDCSPSNNPKLFVESYLFDNYHPDNLIYYRHKYNTRQGGARNTGFRLANSKYVTCIDQDDFYIEDSLVGIIQYISDGCDMIMFDNALSDASCNVRVKATFADRNTPTPPHSGVEFLNKQEISWMPWGYFYKRDFIIDNDFRFVEGVRFEDVDFVLRCIANATKIKFIQQSLICHRETDIQTSAVGNDRYRNIDLIKIAYRVGALADELKQISNDAWGIVLSQHIFMYEAVLKKNVWRLKKSDIEHSISNYPPSFNCNKKILALVRRNPKITSHVYCLLTPGFKMVYFFYSKLK